MGNNPSTLNATTPGAGPMYRDASATSASSSAVSQQQRTKYSQEDREKYKSFPGSAILEKTFCGSIDTTDPSEYEDVNLANRLWRKADIMCVSSLGDENRDETDEFFMKGGTKPIDMDHPKNRASAMLARALVSEVTDNPKTMKQAEMAAREKQLLKAQLAAHTRRTNKHKNQHSHNPQNGNMNSEDESRPVGAPGGVGAPNVLSSLAFAVTGDETAGNVCVHPGAMGGGSNGNSSSMMTPNSFHNDGRGGGGPFGDFMGGGGGGAAGLGDDEDNMLPPLGPHVVTIGLSLSRRHVDVGHPETVTRQTAFDFNELQDRDYKYVSSTDVSGWRAGGGERGGSLPQAPSSPTSSTPDNDGDPLSPTKGSTSGQQQDKMPLPDIVHLPIIHINCESNQQVDQVIHALASGEIFIPHMTILPQSLSVNGISPPDLVVRFDCDRNEDMPPDEWPNWCLEFMHNQLYEYFYSVGARWMKRPFSITLARKVKWKTVKHMNRYFAHAEEVIEKWRERGPQMLDPQLSYVEGGATPEEVAHPHGIYLFQYQQPPQSNRGRNAAPVVAVATNYFAPNFDPPYTTKMTRSLLENVMNKSWDRKRQEWSNEAIPKLVTPNLLLAMACGCTDPTSEGFMAREVTASTIRKTMQDSAVYQQQRQVTPVEADPKQPSRRTPPPQRHDQPDHQPVTPRKSDANVHSSSAATQRIDQANSSHKRQQVSAQDDPELEFEDDEEDDDVDNDDNATPLPMSRVDPDKMGVSNHGVDNKHVASSRYEEKKSDEISEKSLSGRSSKSSKSKSSSKNSRSQAPTWKLSDNNSTNNSNMDLSGEFGASDFSASIALSGTTVMHANVTKSQRKLAEDDWAQPIQSEQSDPAQHQQKKWTKKKKDKQSAKELLDQERKRQEMLLQKVQSGESSGGGSSRKGFRSSSHYKMTPVSPSKRGGSNGGLELDASESAASMEYSHDGSSAYMTEGGSTLFGQQFAGDSPSVARNSVSVNRLTASSTTTDDDNSAFDSIHASSSTMSVIPSDEELLAIGWAKAMDASSGNYYYYTLDRSKIVWDNPLSSNQSADDGGSSKGGGGGAGMDP